MTEMRITVTFPGGDGFTDEITDWDVPDGPGDVQVTLDDGRTVILGGTVSWSIIVPGGPE